MHSSRIRLRLIFCLFSGVYRSDTTTTELRALMEPEDNPIDEIELLSMGIAPELNRVVLRMNWFDQDMRHRLAREYGGLVVIDWNPWDVPAQIH